MVQYVKKIVCGEDQDQSTQVLFIYILYLHFPPSLSPPPWPDSGGKIVPHFDLTLTPDPAESYITPPYRSRLKSTRRLGANHKVTREVQIYTRYLTIRPLTLEHPIPSLFTCLVRLLPNTQGWLAIGMIISLLHLSVWLWLRLWDGC